MLVGAQFPMGACPLPPTHNAGADEGIKCNERVNDKEFKTMRDFNFRSAVSLSVFAGTCPLIHPN